MTQPGLRHTHAAGGEGGLLPRLTLAVLLGLLPAGCDHSRPFENRDPRVTGPRDSVFPIRLTYNLGDDRTATWLPDGSGILYSSERLDHPDHDRCLALLPPGGGAVQSLVCNEAPTFEDSTDVYEAPALSADGRIAYLYRVSRIGRQKQGTAELRGAQAGDPTHGQTITPLPYLAPSGRLHSSVGYIHWAGPSTLVYLGELVTYEGSTFFPDTIVSGLDVIQVELGGGAPVFRRVPGTDYASSVAPGETGDVIYYTLGGDSRVYRQFLSTGERSVAHDFGVGQIARDVQVGGGRLVAVVGRSVLFRLETANGYVQRDEGGDLHVVDLESGAEQVFSRGDVLFRRPVISPAGDRFVAEASPYAPVHAEPESEFNATNHRPDLWLFELP